MPISNPIFLFALLNLLSILKMNLTILIILLFPPELLPPFHTPFHYPSSYQQGNQQLFNTYLGR